MELTRKGDNHIVVKGVIKTFTETQELKDQIDAASSQTKEVTLEFIDAYALASSIIGYLNKKIQADHVKVQTLVHQNELFELMQMLSLVDTLQVKKV